MANRVKLYVDWVNKRLITGLANEGAFIMPKLYQGDVMPFQVYILEPDTSSTAGINSFNLVDIDNMALKFAIGAAPVGDVAEAPFVTQFSWNKNTNEKYFYADVALNTAELDTFLGSASERTDAYMELEVTEGSAITTIYQGTVTIRAEVIEIATESVAAGETPLSLEVAIQMFAGKMMQPGETLTIPSPDGLSRRILGCNNDKSAQDDVL